MKIKKLFIGSGLMILVAVAVLPMLVGAAPTFPPPTGLTDAQFNTITVGTGTGGNAKMIITSDGQLTNNLITFPLSFRHSTGFQFGGAAGANIRFQGNYIDSPLNGFIDIQKISTSGGIYNGAQPGFNPVKIVDNDGITIGNDSGANYLRIWHDASNAYMQAQTGSVQILDTDGLIIKDNAGTIRTQISAGGTGNINTTGTVSSAALYTSGNLTVNGWTGIGTTSPWARLHVKGTGLPSSFLYLDTNNDGQDSGIRLLEGGVVKHHIWNRSSDDALAIITQASGQGIVVASNGNVGIGQHYPTRKLDVLGNAYIGGSLSTNGNITVPSHYIGVGTATPLARLHIRGTGNPSSFLYLDTNSAGQDSGIRLMEGGVLRHHIWNRSSDDALMILANQFNQGIVIAQNGNVGIGQHYPTRKLDVLGNAYIGGSITTNSGVYAQALDATNGIRATQYIQSDGYIFASGNITANGQLTSNGNLIVPNNYIGVGTTLPLAGIHIKKTGFPSSFLYLDTNSLSQDSGLRLMESGAVRHHIYNRSSDDALLIITNNSSQGIEITQSNGNVGMGWATPPEKLSVAGNIRTNSNMYVSGRLGVGTTAPSYQSHVRNTGCGAGCILGRFDGTSYVNIFGDGWIDLGGGMNVNGANLAINNGRHLWVNGGHIYLTTGTGYKPGGGSWGVYSDARLKDVHGSYERGLADILKLSPIEFNYKNGNTLGYDAKPTYVGLVAQEVQKIFPEAVKTDESGFLTLDLHPINIAILHAIQELKLEKDEDVASLRAELAELKALVCELKPNAGQCAQ